MSKLLLILALWVGPVEWIGAAVQGFDIRQVSLGSFGSGSPGTLTLRNGTRYPLTWDDVGWIAKLVWGESSDGNPVHGASVIWTVVQRADIFWPSVVRDSGGQLGHFVRRFSSPIRPNNPTNPHIIAASWNDIPEYARKMALAFAAGQLPNPIPGSVDFANRQLPRPGLRLLARIGYRGPTTGNNFYARQVGSRWSTEIDWTPLVVTGNRGISIVTTEALALYGPQVQDAATSTIGAFLPGAGSLIRRLTGQE